MSHIVCRKSSQDDSSVDYSNVLNKYQISELVHSSSKYNQVPLVSLVNHRDSLVDNGLLNSRQIRELKEINLNYSKTMEALSDCVENTVQDQLREVSISTENSSKYDSIVCSSIVRENGDCQSNNKENVTNNLSENRAEEVIHGDTELEMVDKGDVFVTLSDDDIDSHIVKRVFEDLKNLKNADHSCLVENENPSDDVLDACSHVTDHQSSSMQATATVNEVFGADKTDAVGFGRSKAKSGAKSSQYTMPVERDSEIYNMNHKRRGVAFIFNHMCFDSRLGLKERNGTNADGENLAATLKMLDFEIRMHNDLGFKEIDRILEECAITEDHGESDCLFVSVMTHGEMGILYSSDQPYKPDRLWSHFNAEKCPTLAGKPKIFFIQACQGDQLDSGVHMRRTTTETDSNALSYKIPSHADFLIAYSTIPGFYSWRNTSQGSWFVQAVCHVLRKHYQSRDLLSMMTKVARCVALDFQSNTPGDYFMHEKKQIPCITSMLTRDVIFIPKVNSVNSSRRGTGGQGSFV